MSGLISRIKKKFLPEFIEPKSFERFVLSKNLKNTDSIDLNNIIDLNSVNKVQLKEHIYQSIVLLSSKITAIGLDKNIKYKLESLQIDVSAFSKLASNCANIETQNTIELHTIIGDIKTIFREFRLQKNKFGTSIQLTYKTKIVSKYLDRLTLLVKLYDDNNNAGVWKQLINKYIREYYNHRSVTKYCKYHFDLVLLQAVEHTAVKGEKYIAENKQEYLKFLKKSMLGGFIICLFAFAKLLFDTFKYSDLSNAFIFSLNYALCFILVKKLGGIIATKQPAMTASTIAKYIDKDDNLKIDDVGSVIHITKNTLRSQFISFVGNVSVALPMAIIVFYLWNLISNIVLIDAKKSDILISQIAISNPINLYYAAIAGVFLALSGFISGYVDNKLKFSKIKYRIEGMSILNVFFSPTTVNRISYYIENHSGAFIGNISLGFLLGSAFLLGDLFSIPFDIRHIAFSASYLGTLVFDESLTSQLFWNCFIGVWMIGVVNFAVSFFITLSITLKTRGITMIQLLDSSKGLLMEFLRRPISFFYFSKPVAK